MPGLTGRARPARARLAAATVVGSLAAGVPVGVLWWLVAPMVLFVKRPGGLYPGEGDESAVAADGWFALLTVLAGAATALVVYLRTRPARLTPLLALAAGGLLGAAAAWQTGHLLGPGPLEPAAAGLPVGARLRAPLDVSAYAVLLGWPMAAVVTYFALAAGAEGGAGDEHNAPGGSPGRAPDGRVSPGATEPSGPR